MRGFVLLAVFALAGCATFPTPPGLPGQTWVMVTGPANSGAPEDLVLEIGETAWQGYGGVVSLEAQSALDVRLVGRESCRSYASFSAPVGTMWVIRFAGDGTVGVEAQRPFTTKAMRGTISQAATIGRP